MRTRRSCSPKGKQGLHWACQQPRPQHPDAPMRLVPPALRKIKRAIDRARIESLLGAGDADAAFDLWISSTTDLVIEVCTDYPTEGNLSASGEPPDRRVDDD